MPEIEAATPDLTQQTPIAVQPASPETVPLLDFDVALDAIGKHLVKDDPEYANRLARLRSNPVIGGVAGSIAEQMRRVSDEQARVEAVAEASRAKEQELLDLAENDPEEFAAKFRTDAQANRAKAELQEIRVKEQERLSGHIGLAVRDLPEMQTLDLKDQQSIANALAGVPADQVLGVYVRTVADITANKRARVLADAEFQTRFDTEYEARQAASNATRLRTTAAPALGVGPRTVPDEPDFRADPMGWLKWNDSRKR